MTEYELLLLIEEKIDEDAAKAFTEILAENRRYSSEKGWRQAALSLSGSGDASIDRLMEEMLDGNPYQENRNG